MKEIKKFETESMANVFVIVGTVKLRRKDPCPGDGTENTEIKNKNQAVYNGYSAHGDGADLADHNIIQQVDQLRDAVLNHHRQGNG